MRNDGTGGAEMSAAERKWPVIVDDNSTRVSKPDYSWRKDNAPPLPKDLWSDDSTPAPVAMPTATRVVEGQLQKKAKRPGFFKTHHRIFSSGFAAQIGTRPLVFYLRLLAKANEEGAWTFSASDDEVARETGISPSSLREYRAALKAQGLIDYSWSAGTKLRCKR